MKSISILQEGHQGHRPRQQKDNTKGKILPDVMCVV
jgi:hypothetical protein